MPAGWCPLRRRPASPTSTRSTGRARSPRAANPTAHGLATFHRDREAMAGSSPTAPPDGPAQDGTTCRGRSTTPSWTRSCSSGRPASRNTKVDDWVKAGGRPGHRALAEAVPGRGPGQGGPRGQRRRHRANRTWSSGAIPPATRSWRRSPTSCRSAGAATRSSRPAERSRRDITRRS